MTNGSKRYLDPATLSAIAGLEVRARHIVEGYLAGLHRSPMHGRSVEFAQHRAYAAGDEIRHIDWRLWARSDRFFVKLSEPDTNLPAYFLMDASGSMGYGSGAMTKYDYGCALGAALACLLLMQQDAVGLVLFEDEVRGRLPARASPAQLGELCRMLEEHEPAGRTDLGGLLHGLADELGRRGMVVLVSDMLAPLDDIVSALQRLRFDGHSVIVVHVMDPDELELPFDGNVRFEGLEAEGALQADARQLRSAYRHAFERFSRGLQEACQQQEIDYLAARTDRPLDVTLARFLTSRAGGY